MKLSTYDQAGDIQQLIQDAASILIIQADNPDADSLGSALALETILGDLGKQTFLYCGVEIPGYLRYLNGWDRVDSELPHKFDLSIIVDASTMTLLEKLSNSGKLNWVATKPCLILDHHESVDNIVPFSTIIINDSNRASAGELIFLICRQLNWTMSESAQEFLMSSILGDTQGLSNQLASAETYFIMALMIESGVNRPKIEDLRREFGKMPAVIYKYKADLIKHTLYSADNKIAYVTVPQEEINIYSPLYNPGPLIQNDMLQTEQVLVAIVFKTYEGGKITAAIRSNPAAAIAADLAKHFGGGGHAYASGFKVTRAASSEEIISECIDAAGQLLLNGVIRTE